MTMTFKEACKEVCSTVTTCLTDKENYKLVMKLLILGGLAFSSFISGSFAIIGTGLIIFNDIENLREGIEWMVPATFLVAVLTGFTAAVLTKMRGFNR